MPLLVHVTDADLDDAGKAAAAAIRAHVEVRTIPERIVGSPLLQVQGSTIFVATSHSNLMQLGSIVADCAPSFDPLAPALGQRLLDAVAAANKGCEIAGVAVCANAPPKKEEKDGREQVDAGGCGWRARPDGRGRPNGWAWRRR